MNPQEHEVQLHQARTDLPRTCTFPGCTQPVTHVVVWRVSNSAEVRRTAVCRGHVIDVGIHVDVVEAQDLASALVTHQLSAKSDPVSVRTTGS